MRSTAGSKKPLRAKTKASRGASAMEASPPTWTAALQQEIKDICNDDNLEVGCKADQILALLHEHGISAEGEYSPELFLVHMKNRATTTLNHVDMENKGAAMIASGVQLSKLTDA